MDREQLEEYIQQNIPISQSIGAQVLEIKEDSLTLQAPFQANINHKGTVFGGSQAALAMLSGWSVVRHLLEIENIPGEIVIRKGESQFFLPTESDFFAKSFFPNPQEREKFFSSLAKRGKGRVIIKTEILCQKQICSEFRSEFVAIGK